MADQIDEAKDGGQAELQEQPAPDAAPDAVSLVHAASLAVLFDHVHEQRPGREIRRHRSSPYSDARARPIAVRDSGFSSDEMSPGSSPLTTARMARRTILADLVRGRSRTNTTRSGRK